MEKRFQPSFQTNKYTYFSIIYKFSELDNITVVMKKVGISIKQGFCPFFTNNFCEKITQSEKLPLPVRKSALSSTLEILEIRENLYPLSITY